MRPNPPQTSRFGLMLSLLTLVFVSGSQWPLLQGVAWARMIVVYAQEGTLGEAIEQTFSGQRPCPLCHQAQKGQHQDGDKAPWQGPASALELIPTVPTAVAVAPDFSLAWLVGINATVPREFSFAPPKPPPRRA